MLNCCHAEFGPGTGKAASPRRRPPPPPSGGSAFGRSTSGLPLSPTQGSLQRLPSDAFAEAPSQSRAPFTDPMPLSQSPQMPDQQIQSSAFGEPKVPIAGSGLPFGTPSNAEVPTGLGAPSQGAPASTRAVSQAPTSTGLASQPAISTGAQTQPPSSTGVSTMPVTTGRMSVMPTGAGIMIQEGEVVPVPPVSSSVTQVVSQSLAPIVHGFMCLV